MVSEFQFYWTARPDPRSHNIKELRLFQRVNKGVPCCSHAVSLCSCGLSMYSRGNVVRYVEAAYPQIGKFSAGNPPFLANLPGRGSNLGHIRESRPPFFPSSSASCSPFFCPPTTQNSLLFYVDAPFSGWLCHHSLLFLNYPHLLQTMRQDMPAAQNHLPFIHVNVATDTRKISLANLSYPIRSNHTAWVEPSVPLVIKVRSLK